MAVLEEFGGLLQHPSPGLCFPAHARAHIPARIMTTTHVAGPPASPGLLAGVRRLAADAPAVAEELVAFYSRWNGVELCRLPSPFGAGIESALHILPADALEDATAEVRELDWMQEAPDDLNAPGAYVAFAAHESESTRLIIYLRGEMEGHSVVGKIFTVSVEPVMDPVADSFFGMLRDFVTDPIAVMKRAGTCYTVTDAVGQMYGAVAERYLPDVRAL